MDLRPYQIQFVKDIYSEIRAGEQRILGVMPTGGGKTIVASRIMADAASRGKRVMIVVHRDILVEQTFDKLTSFGLNDQCGFIKSGWSENQDAMIQIASVQTMTKRDWWQDYPLDLCILDECHITAWSNTIKQMMEEIHRHTLYLGITATPWRLKKTQGMGDIFESLVTGPMPLELMEMGFLVKPSYYGVDLVGRDDFATDATGDFDTGSLAIAYDTPEVIQQCINEWFRLAYKRRTIVFAINVQHSKNLCEGFLDAGIPAAHVDGKTPIKLRKKLYDQLDSGEILVLCSCMALTEGFDVPPVDAIILLRKTLSKALVTQMIGRGLRLSESTGKTDCVVLDFVGNVSRHGFIEDITADDIELLSGREKSKIPPAKKVCPVDEGGCGAILYAFLRKCPKCQHSFEAQQLTPQLGLSRMLRSEDVELVHFYRSLLQQAYQRKMAPSWAAVQFKNKYGYYPPFDWGRGAVFGESANTEQFLHYQQHLKAISARLNKDNPWCDRYLQMEFGYLEIEKAS